MHATGIRLLFRLLVLSLAFALPGCASNPAPAGAATTPADANSPELTLVTLNIWHDKGDWPKRKELIVAKLRELHPDVIALQEVLQHEGLPNQAQAIAQALGYRYVFASTDPPGGPKRFGNAILTRHPILAHDWHALEPLDDYRNILQARIDFDGTPVNVYNTHLHWTEGGGAIRATQVADALDWIGHTKGDAPSLLAGDLNADMGAPELQPLLAEFLDAYATLHPDVRPGDRAHSTLNLAKFDKPRHIDQVLPQRGAFTPLEARVILDQPDAEGVWPSDHYGVLARFRLDASSTAGAPSDAPGRDLAFPEKPVAPGCAPTPSNGDRTMHIRFRCCLALPLIMALAGCQSPGTPETPTTPPTTPPGTTPATTDVPTARWRCDVLLVASRFPEGEVELRFSGRSLTLPQVRSGSGIRYADDSGNAFRSKGDSASLTLAGEPPRDCTTTTQVSPWEQARERGVAFRAVGNEPGWWVEVGSGDSPGLRALLDYGEREILVAQARGISNTQGFGGKAADGTDVVLRIHREPCSDGMSGEAFEARAELTVGDKRYDGCGAWLDD